MLPSLLEEVGVATPHRRPVDDVRHLASLGAGRRRPRPGAAGSDRRRHIRVRLDEVILIVRANFAKLKRKTDGNT